MNLKCLFCRCDCLDKASGVFVCRNCGYHYSVFSESKIDFMNMALDKMMSETDMKMMTSYADDILSLDAMNPYALYVKGHDILFKGKLTAAMRYWRNGMIYLTGEINDKKDKYIINYFSLMIIKSIREYCMKKYKKGFKKYLSSPSLMTKELILDAINYSYILFDLSRKIVKLDIPDIAIIIILNDLINSVGDDFLKTIDKCKQEFEKIYKNKEYGNLETEIKVLNEIIFIMLEMRRYSHLDSSLRLMYEVFGKVHDLMVYSDENDHGGESEKFSSLIDEIENVKEMIQAERDLSIIYQSSINSFNQFVYISLFKFYGNDDKDKINNTMIDLGYDQDQINQLQFISSAIINNETTINEIEESAHEEIPWLSLEILSPELKL